MATRSAMADHAEVVQPIDGEWFRFHVQSRTGHKPYLVDLEEYGFNGWCDCDGFKYNREPLLARGARPSQSLRCWHIEQATLYFMRHVGPVLARELNKKPAEQTKHERRRSSEAVPQTPKQQQQQSTPSQHEPRKVYTLKFRQFDPTAKGTRFKAVR